MGKRLLGYKGYTYIDHFLLDKRILGDNNLDSKFKVKAEDQT
jgi:hypothetical protein